MSWYKLQGYVRYIIQYLCETDLEQVIFNGFQQVCRMVIVVHYAVMVQLTVGVYRWESYQV